MLRTLFSGEGTASFLNLQMKFPSSPWQTSTTTKYYHSFRKRVRKCTVVVLILKKIYACIYILSFGCRLKNIRTISIVQNNKNWKRGIILTIWFLLSPMSVSDFYA